MLLAATNLASTRDRMTRPREHQEVSERFPAATLLVFGRLAARDATGGPVSRHQPSLSRSARSLRCLAVPWPCRGRSRRNDDRYGHSRSARREAPGARPPRLSGRPRSASTCSCRKLLDGADAAEACAAALDWFAGALPSETVVFRTQTADRLIRLAAKLGLSEDAVRVLRRRAAVRCVVLGHPYPRSGTTGTCD